MFLTLNNFFSDELSILNNDGANPAEVPLLNTGIAWASDRKNKFRNPPLDESLPKKEALRQGL